MNPCPKHPEFREGICYYCDTDARDSKYMRPMALDTLDEILVDFHCDGLLVEEARYKILELVSKAIQENRHGFGLTVAEGEQLARRVKVALT